MTEPTDITDQLHVPDYLRGRISDVRAEPDGGVSFKQPDANPGANSELYARVKLDADSARATFDPSYRLSNPAETAIKQHQPLTRLTMQESISSTIGNKARNVLSGISGSELGNTAAAGLISALAGGVGGAWLANRNGEPMLGKSLLYALLGGGIGAGTAALWQAQGNRALRQQGLLKQASLGSAIAGDYNLTQYQKDILGSVVVQLSPQDKQKLETLVSQAVGASAGLLIAKYLGLRGLLPPAILALLGISVGRMFSQGRPIYSSTGSLIKPL